MVKTLHCAAVRNKKYSALDLLEFDWNECKYAAFEMVDSLEWNLTVPGATAVPPKSKSHLFNLSALVAFIFVFPVHPAQKIRLSGRNLHLSAKN
jgi:hypothetical protein